MSNQPDRFELFLVPDGMEKITQEKDLKVPNAATFTFLREDHTLANVLRMQLLKNPKVIFAGYKVPHPLEHNFELKIQTTPDSSPIIILRQEVDNLIAEVSSITNKFKNELTMHGLNQATAPALSNVDRDF